ncbi:hypothetical protein SALBM135S_05568 [Streptomyces alboniger]
MAAGSAVGQVKSMRTNRPPGRSTRKASAMNAQQQAGARWKAASRQSARVRRFPRHRHVLIPRGQGGDVRHGEGGVRGGCVPPHCLGDLLDADVDAERRAARRAQAGGGVAAPAAGIQHPVTSHACSRLRLRISRRRWKKDRPPMSAGRVAGV